MRRKANPCKKLAQRELTKHVRIASGMGRANAIPPSPTTYGPQSLLISKAQLSAGAFLTFNAARYCPRIPYMYLRYLLSQSSCAL